MATEIPEFLLEGYFVCEGCDELFETKDMRAEADMDGEEGDYWKLCPACHAERYPKG